MREEGSEGSHCLQGPRSASSPLPHPPALALNLSPSRQPACNLGPLVPNLLVGQHEQALLILAPGLLRKETHKRVSGKDKGAVRRLEAKPGK